MRLLPCWETALASLESISLLLAHEPAHLFLDVTQGDHVDAVRGGCLGERLGGIGIEHLRKKNRVITLSIIYLPHRHDCG